MINPDTVKAGKLSSSLLSYSLRVAAHEMGLPHLFPGEAKDYHQISDSKLTFRWDQNGNEIVLDSYIDKLVQNTKKLCSEIFTVIADEKNSDLVENINNHLISILQLSHKPEELDSKSINDLIKHLELIEKLIQQTNHSAKVLTSIQHLIEFSKKSIPKEASKAFVSEINMREFHPTLTENIKKNIHSPSIAQLKKMPVTDAEKPIKKQTRQFLQYLGGVYAFKVKFDKSTEREHTLAEFIRSTLRVINSSHMSKDQKILYIQKLQQQINERLREEIFLSAKISGALEGVKESLAYGGLTTLKTLMPLIADRSKNEIEVMEQYDREITQFTEIALDYVKGIQDENQVSGSAAQKESEELALSLSFTADLQKAINHTGLMILSVLRKKESAEQIQEYIQGDLEIMKSMKMQIEKLKKGPHEILAIDAEDRMQELKQLTTILIQMTSATKLLK